MNFLRAVWFQDCSIAFYPIFKHTPGFFTFLQKIKSMYINYTIYIKLFYFSQPQVVFWHFQKSEMTILPKPSVVIRTAGSNLIFPTAVDLECTHMDLSVLVFSRPQIRTSPCRPPATILCRSKSTHQTSPSCPDFFQKKKMFFVCSQKKIFFSSNHMTFLYGVGRYINCLYCNFIYSIHNVV